MKEWVAVSDDAYCGARWCRAITVERDGIYLTERGPRPYVLRQLRKRTGQRHFGDLRPLRASSDKFWKWMWEMPSIDRMMIGL